MVHCRQPNLIRIVSMALLCVAHTSWANPDPQPGGNAPSIQPQETAAPVTTPADPIERRVGEIAERTQRMNAGDALRTNESGARNAQRLTELDGLREQLNVALSMPPGSSERAAQIDQTWENLHNLVIRLIDDRDQAIQALQVAQQDRATAEADAPTTAAERGSKIEQAMQDFLAAHNSRVDVVEAEIDAISELLRSARILRRRAQEDVSQDALLSFQTQQLSLIQSEVKSIPLDLRSSFRQTVQAWWKRPAELSEVQALGALFLGLMELALLLVFGMWVHSQIPAWTRRLLKQIEPDTEGRSWASRNRLPSWIIPGDLHSLAPTLSPLLQDLLILLISLTVMGWTEASVPLVAWIALMFAMGAGVRGAQSLTTLLLITPTESRPGLRVTAPEVRAGALWLIQYFGMLKAIEVTVVYLLVAILGADQIGSLFSDAVGIGAWLLAGIALIKWGTVLRNRVQAGGAESTMARWVVQSGTSQINGLVGALLAVFVLLFRWLWSLVQGLIDSRGGLTWLATLLARRELRDGFEHQATPLPASMVRAINNGSLQNLNCNAEINMIVEQHHQWQQDPRRGLVALTGDRGAGKHVVMSQLTHAIDAPLFQATAPTGHTQEQHALRWLSQVAQVQTEANSEALIESLKKLPPSVFLLSNLHRLFLRAVGHYRGLDTVLKVMQATARHHFWVCSFHHPAWSFLEGMSHVGHVNVFAKRIHLGAFDPPDLSQWLTAQTRKAGLEPKFDALTQKRATGPDRSRMLERTERAYWRLLTDAAQGNPSVAMRLWLSSLHPDPGSTTSAFVSLFTGHETDELEQLQDDELFALTAIIIHEDLTVKELHIVLNMSEASVRALCRGLEQRTLIIETESGRYKVRLNWLPAVERHLRRRIFLHKE